MALNPKKTVILFDLDNTLFDHSHSLLAAIQAIQAHYPALSHFQPAALAELYNRAHKAAQTVCLRRKIRHTDQGWLRVVNFFSLLNLPFPTEEVIEEFRKIYNVAYRASWRATKDSIDTLIKLKKVGYKLAIVTNGPKEGQREKAKAIGVDKLVERIFTSEEARASKPDPKIFRWVLEKPGVDVRNYFMVGDSVKADIKGALGVGIQPILFAPLFEPQGGKECEVLGQRVPVIRRMSELLSMFGANI